MKAPLIVSLFVVLGCTAALGDEQMRRAQEELRKRNIYFGDIDGRKSPEISGAIKRYQERKGFPTTGELDADTLRSLQLAPPDSAPKAPAQSWPDIPVLKSDIAPEILESDRKALESAPPSEPAPVAEPPPAEPIVPRGAEANKLTERAEAFVRSYLEAAKTNELDAEMAFYADRIDYFDHGTVGREFIERDVRRYYKRWPQRNYQLLDFKVVKAAGEDFDAVFRIEFHVKNREHSVVGKTSNVFRIHRVGENMRFVALKEQRLRE